MRRRALRCCFSTHTGAPLCVAAFRCAAARCAVVQRAALLCNALPQRSCRCAAAHAQRPAFRDVAAPEAEADAHVALCASLQLTGRVLLAAEGINGTLCGSDTDVEAYIAAMCAHPLFRMRRDDFKRSAAAGAADPFSRELFVLVVPEIIASGGAFAGVPLALTGQGYLTPTEWRDALQSADANTVVIDVRNRNEVQLGGFAGALDPRTRSFAEFPAWCAANAEALRAKRVLMYCTGGVRCEKASAFLRTSGLASEVRHLQGGIHKYIDAFGEDELWRGKNFVFDRRGALGGEAAGAASRHVVGRCVGCAGACEQLDGRAACTVCNEPVLCCDGCRAAQPEQHCEEHAHLRTCFFRRLRRFSAGELTAQLAELEALLHSLEAEKRRGAGRRRTLAAQAARVRAALAGEADVADADVLEEAPSEQAPPQLLWVRGRFPTDEVAARAAWPLRIWPLSARPWAFIRDVAAPDGASLAVEVDCKVCDDAYDLELGARLAPQGRPSRTRVWGVAWDAARQASQVAVAVQQAKEPLSPADAKTQSTLHLRWLGFEPLNEKLAFCT
jgi:UPF0176 protein